MLRVQEKLYCLLSDTTQYQVKKVEKLLCYLYNYPHGYGNVNAPNIVGNTVLELCCKNPQYLGSVHYLCSLRPVALYLQERNNAEPIIKACMRHNNYKAFYYLQKVFSSMTNIENKSTQEKVNSFGGSKKLDGLSNTEPICIFPDMALLFTKVLYSMHKNYNTCLLKNEQDEHNWYQLLSSYDFNYQESIFGKTPLAYLEKNKKICGPCTYFFLMAKK